MLVTTALGVLGALGQMQSPTAPPIDCAATGVAEMQKTAIARFKEGEAALLASRWTEAEAALLKATSREAFRCASGMSDEDRKRRVQEVHELRETLRGLDQRRLKEIGAKWKEMNGDVRTPGTGILSVQDVERRLAELERSLKDADPAPPGVTLALGTALFQTGRVADAETAFRDVLARDPKSGDAHNNLALVCMLTGRLEEAEREMAAARKAGIPVNPRLKQEIDRRKREPVRNP